MAHSITKRLPGGHTLYDELLDAEERKFSRRHGERRLIGEVLRLSGKPSGRLARLRSREPVEVPCYLLPRPVRDGRDPLARVVVYPDGRIADA
jgi:hypothetical protein